MAGWLARARGLVRAADPAARVARVPGLPEVRPGPGRVRRREKKGERSGGGVGWGGSWGRTASPRRPPP